MDGILIIGAGGHGRVVCDALMALGKNIAGFLDRDDRKVGDEVMGHRILDQEKTLAEIDPGKVILANGVGDLRVRKAIHQTCTASGFRFETVIHPSVIMARDVAIEAGVQIMAGSIIQTGVRLAANALINTRSSVDHDCAIGMHAFLGPGVTLCGTVTVGAAAHIGTGTTILEKIEVGENSVVGGGSMLIHHLEPNVTAVGVPARVIKRHEE